MTPQTWQEWREHILAELNRLNSSYEALDHKLDALTVQVAMLRVKAGVWGVCAGAVPVLIALAIYFLRGMVTL